MPSHWGSRRLNIVSQSSPTGTQWLQAVGCAEAGRYFRDFPQAVMAAAPRPRFENDEIVYVSGGEGAASQGEFYEALNLACLGRLPVLFLIEDNGYAISVPGEAQTAGGNVSRLVRNFPGLYVNEVDGTDLVASYGALREAAAWCRSGRGPALVHGHVIRPYSHSPSDDERLYKPEQERQEEAARDPIPRLARFLVEEGLLEEQGIRAMERDVDREIQEATNRALVVYEDCRSWGYGAEIAARIADELFDELDAPVRRVAALDTFVAYQPLIEDEILPQARDVEAAILSLAEY